MSKDRSNLLFQEATYSQPFIEISKYLGSSCFAVLRETSSPFPIDVVHYTHWKWKTCYNIAKPTKHAQFVGEVLTPFLNSLCLSTAVTNNVNPRPSCSSFLLYRNLSPGSQSQVVLEWPCSHQDTCDQRQTRMKTSPTLCFLKQCWLKSRF